MALFCHGNHLSLVFPMMIAVLHDDCCSKRACQISLVVISVWSNLGHSTPAKQIQIGNRCPVDSMSVEILQHGPEA